MSENPYEAPQSSLEPEQRPPVEVKHVHNFARLLLRIVVEIISEAGVMIMAIIGMILLFRLAAVISNDPAGDLAGLDRMLPYLIIGFIGIGGALWWLPKSAA